MDSTLEARESVIKPDVNEAFSKPLTADLAADTAFKTFRFSQGSLETQRLFFKYMHAVAPNWRMDDDLQQRTLETSRKLIHAFLYPKNKDAKHLHISEKEFEMEVYNQLEVLQSILKGDEVSLEGNQMNHDTLLIQIAHSMIMSDYKFLIYQGGRPNRGENSGGRVFSFYKNYIKRKTSTENVFFDRLFSDIRNIMDKPEGGSTTHWAVKPTHPIVERGIRKPIEALEEMAGVWK